MTEADYPLNAEGLRCPMPVLRLRRQLAAMQKGQTVLLTASDPNADKDVPAFCLEADHKLLWHKLDGTRRQFLIEKSVD